MAKLNSYRELLVWQKSMTLAEGSVRNFVCEAG